METLDIHNELLSLQLDAMTSDRANIRYCELQEELDRRLGFFKIVDYPAGYHLLGTQVCTGHVPNSIQLDIRVPVKPEYYVDACMRVQGGPDAGHIRVGNFFATYAEARSAAAKMKELLKDLKCVKH
jgi:hypothetical protein